MGYFSDADVWALGGDDGGEDQDVGSGGDAPDAQAATPGAVLAAGVVGLPGSSGPSAATPLSFVTALNQIAANEAASADFARVLSLQNPATPELLNQFGAEADSQGAAADDAKYSVDVTGDGTISIGGYTTPLFASTNAGESGVASDVPTLASKTFTSAQAVASGSPLNGNLNQSPGKSASNGVLIGNSGLSTASGTLTDAQKLAPIAGFAGPLTNEAATAALSNPGLTGGYGNSTNPTAFGANFFVHPDGVYSDLSMDSLVGNAIASVGEAGMAYDPKSLTLSSQGTNLLKSMEMLRLNPYDDQTSNDISKWVRGATIGYGYLVPQNEWDAYKDGITSDTADSLFNDKLKPYIESVQNNVQVPLSQNQFDALVLLSYNIGATAFENSSALKMINDPTAKTSYDSLENAWKAFDVSQGNVMQGLVNRRNTEWNIYNQDVYKKWWPNAGRLLP